MTNCHIVKKKNQFLLPLPFSFLLFAFAFIHHRERTEKIINDLFEFGVPVDLLFDVDDLIMAKDIPKVNGT